MATKRACNELSRAANILVILTLTLPHPPSPLPGETCRIFRHPHPRVDSCREGYACKLQWLAPQFMPQSSLNFVPSPAKQRGKMEPNARATSSHAPWTTQLLAPQLCHRLSFVPSPANTEGKTATKRARNELSCSLR